MNDITTIEQLAVWGWGLGFITGALVLLMWEITEDDDSNL